MKKIIPLGLAALVAGCNIGKVNVPNIQTEQTLEKVKWTPDKVPQRVSSQELMQLSHNEAAETLSGVYGYELTGNDLNEIARLLYLEGGRDKAAWKDGTYDHDAIREYYQAIMFSILNRHNFDIPTTDFDDMNCTRQFRFSDGTLISVVHDHKSEYDAYDDNPLMFTKQSLQKASDSNQVFTEQQTRRLKRREHLSDVDTRADLALEAIYQVLTNEVEDPTNGSMFYRANGWGDLTGKSVKSQGVTSQDYCDAWGITEQYPGSKMQCRLECDFYTDDSKANMHGSHKFKPLKVKEKRIVWVDGKKTVEAF